MTCQCSGRIREFNLKHLSFGVGQSGGRERFLGCTRPVYDEMGEPSLVVRKSKDIHPRIPKHFRNMRDHSGEVFVGKRELVCSSTPQPRMQQSDLCSWLLLLRFAYGRRGYSVFRLGWLLDQGERPYDYGMRGERIVQPLSASVNRKLKLGN